MFFYANELGEYLKESNNQYDKTHFTAKYNTTQDEKTYDFVIDTFIEKLQMLAASSYSLETMKRLDQEVGFLDRTHKYVYSIDRIMDWLYWDPSLSGKEEIQQERKIHSWYETNIRELILFNKSSSGSKVYKDAYWPDL